MPINARQCGAMMATGILHAYNNLPALPNWLAPLAPANLAYPLNAWFHVRGLLEMGQEGPRDITSTLSSLVVGIITTVMGLALEHYYKIPFEQAVILSGLISLPFFAGAAYVLNRQADVARLRAAM